MDVEITSNANKTKRQCLISIKKCSLLNITRL